MVEAPDPERLLIVARFADGRYLLVREYSIEEGDAPPPRLLHTRRAGAHEPPERAVRAILELRLGLSLLEEPRILERRTPVRETQGRYGRSGPGWLRGAAVRVEGEPRPQPPLAEALLLPLDEATAALAAGRERVLLTACAELLEPAS